MCFMVLYDPKIKLISISLQIKENNNKILVEFNIELINNLMYSTSFSLFFFETYLQPKRNKFNFCVV